MTWQFAKLTNKQVNKARVKSRTRITNMAFLLKLTKSNNTWQDLNSIKFNLNNTQEFNKTTMFNLLKFPIVI